MNQKHTNESNYTKLVMPRQLVLPLDYGMLIKETAPFFMYCINVYNSTKSYMMSYICHMLIIRIIWFIHMLCRNQ